MSVSHCPDLLVFICDLKGHISSALDTVIVLEERIEVVRGRAIRVSIIRVVKV